MSRYGCYKKTIKGMENKLTINELAPYLPCGLKCHCMGEHIDDYEDVPEPCIFKMTGLLNNNRVSLTYLCEKKVFDIDEVFPLLYPLSHLTKEIEVNGEKVVLADKLKFSPNNSTEIKVSPYDLNIEIEDNESYYPSGLYEIDFKVWYSWLNLLLKYHFDVFGLIEKGLAVDKTTL